MTKTNETEATSLKWRLAKQPTLEDVLKLKEAGLLKDEEARSMLFSTENTNDKIKALEEQVKFLQDVVEKLSNKPQQNVWNYVETYKPRNPWGTTHFGNPIILCSAIGTNVTGSLAVDNTSGRIIA